MNVVAKTCRCGRRHTLLEWSRLPSAGDMKDEAEHLELRNCPCGSTLALKVAYEDTGSRFYETEEDEDACR